MVMLTGLVPRRLPLDLKEYGMSSDDKEMVFPLANPDAYSRWMVGRASFSGDAYSFAEKVEFRGEIENTATISVGEGRVIGIIAPDSKDSPAVWFSWPIQELRTSTRGTSGLIKKRPDFVILEGQTGSLSLFVISRLYRTSYKAKQEAAFLASLGS